MRILMLLAALAMSAISPAVVSADAPAFSIERVLVTAGVDYAKFSEPVGNNFAKAWEFKPSVNIAYNLGSYSSVVASYSRGLKNDVSEYRVGIRLRIFRGLKDGQ